MSKTSQKQPIAVVGMACMFPKAKDLKGFWQVVRMGVDTTSEIPESHWSPGDYFDDDPKAPDKTYARRGGFLEPYGFDPTEFSLPPTVLEATDTSQLLGLVVAKAALDDAGYGPQREFQKETTSVILGVTGCLELVIPLGARLGHPYWRKALLESGVSAEVAEEVMERIADDYVPWQENSFPGLLGNVVAGRIANRLDLHGTNCVVDAACASTLSAAHLAMMELECGRSDMVITGGTDTFNDIFMYMCFSKTPALSASGKIRPFDAESDGTLLGEGLGMVVLKRLEDAEADGDRIYCVLKSMGTSSDGSQKAVYAPYSPGQTRALRKAYEQAEVDPRTISLVEAHGTGTKVGDVVEFEALKAVYSEASEEKQWCALGSVKSQIGHTKAAAGAAGLVKAALALHHKVLLPTINIEQPNPKLGVEDSPFYLNTEASPWLSREGHPRRAALSSFGFGGSNFHSVLEEYETTKTQVSWDGSVQLVAFSARTRDHLVTLLQQELNELASLDVLAHRSRQAFDRSLAHRLVLVVEPGQLRHKLEDAVVQLEAGEVPEFYHHNEEVGPVAFLFPGQGSQYVGMARELSCVFPEMLESLEVTGSEVVSKIYPRPVFSKADQKEQQAELTSTDMAQPALGAINVGMMKILERFGLKPAFTAGHSYGELCALHAAGVFDHQSLVELSCLRGQLMANLGEDLGTMLAVTGPLEEVEKVLEEGQLNLKLANRNSPTQGVLSGTKEEVKKARQVMKKAGLTAIPLQVAAAFHSPLVAGARDPFREGMNKTKFKKAKLPVYANKTAGIYPGGDKKSKEILADQLVHEVNFVGMIEKMYEDGARVFVEVGPKRVLTKLVGAILKDREHQAIALDASQGKKRALVDLARGLAQLVALGLELDLEAWEVAPVAPRKKRMEVTLTGANYRGPRKPRPPVRKPEPKREVAVAKTPKLEARVTPAPSPTPVATPKPVAPRPVQADNRVFQEAFQSVQSTLAAMQTMAQQTAEAHQRFLEGQEQAQKTFQRMVEGQQLLVNQMMGESPRPAPRALPAAPAPVASAPAPVPVPVQKAAPVAKQSPPKPLPPAPAPVAKKESASEVAQTMLAVVADKTGYPVEMLNLEMDLEADLGIDSIKRVEILAAVEEAIPDLPRVEPDQMGSLRTLREIVERLTPVATVSNAAPVSADPAVASTLLQVVADKTGYPVEMLNLEMDLEADLGIDSIKRVEILAAVEEAIPSLPKVEPDQMGALRTLGQIVEALGASPVLSAASPAPASADPAVATKLLEVVADKTGYPVEMLNLEMDLEADLGIDSIKRVEILAAVEEAIPSLPKVEPDQMGALRSLGQIVEALGGNREAPSLVLSPSNGSGQVSQSLLDVVAEKTGYPVEMLNLEMDLEADLGIDSIKRVEILAAMEEAVPGLPKVAPDQMGSLRTLGQIVEVLDLGVSPAPSAAEGLEQALLQVVAEKTGYPTEMLNLDMDLEADLGIDSINRVEILAAVEEKHSVKAVSPDEMGSLRSLRQVLAALAPSNGVATPSPALARPTQSERPLGRQVLRAVDLPEGRPIGFPAPKEGAVAIAEDRPGLGQSVLKALKKRGLTAELVSGDKLPKKVATLILIANGGEWDETEAFLKRAFRLTQKAAAPLREQRGLLASISVMGGDFGLRGVDFDPLTGAVAGLPKTAAHEWPEVTTRALDVSSEVDGESIVEELCVEAPLEVGLQPGRRVGLITEEVKAPAGQPALGRGDLVVITGGARGVTAKTAIALAAAVQPNILLLGRSPEPEAEPDWLKGLSDEAATKRAILKEQFGNKANPAELERAYRKHMANREIRSTLEALEAAGSKVAYRSADVRNRKALEKTLKSVVKELGPVRGVIHGAGVLADRKIEDKQAEQFDAVFDTKVQGLKNLLELTEKLKALVLFSSVTSRFGRPGQLDYCMANEVLNKVAQRYDRQNPRTRVASLCWGPWDGGMVTPGLRKEFERLGVGLIPLEAGAKALVEELARTGADGVEILLGDGFPSPEKPASQQLERPLNPVLQKKLSTKSFPFLESHVIGGRPVLPMALILEWFAHAALHGNIGLRFVGLEDLKVLKGLALEEGLEPTVTVAAGQADVRDGVSRVMVELRDLTRNILHARATAVLASEHPEAPPLEPLSGLASRAYPYEAGQIYEKLLFHGRHFHGIKTVEGLSEKGLVADLLSAPKPAQWISDPVRSEWLTDPLAVDSILQLGILWCIEQMDKPSLPNGGARYRQYRRRFPKDGLRAVLRVANHSNHLMSADVYLTDKKGEVVASFEGLEWTADASLRNAFAKRVLATK